MNDETHVIPLSRVGDGIQNATRSKLRRLLPVCPVCHKAITGHRFAKIGSVVVAPGREASLEAFFSAFRAHKWQELVQFREWRADSDAMIVYAVRGQHDVTALVMAREVYELFEADEVFLQVVVEADEIDECIARLAPTWTSL